MRNINIALGRNSYGIIIGVGLLETIGEQLSKLGLNGKAVIVTNPYIKELYGNKLEKLLEGAGFRSCIVTLPDGEEFKSLDQAGELYRRFSECNIERMTPVLALGGGVIGDLAGFVAATYMRGVPLIQLPTTLLAQVDSSIGGKTAVNHGGLKNIIGAFYQPDLVIADISSLATLPPEEVLNGLSEVIKYGVIRDRELFELVETNISRLTGKNRPDFDLLEEVVFRCARIKASFVEQDERDTGIRNLLNLGHTVGHAVETVSDFRIKHGRAVAIGMVAAGNIALRQGIFPEADLARLTQLLSRAGLPEKISGLDVSRIMEATQHDKKVSGGKIRFILPRIIGDAFIADNVELSLVEQVLKDCYE
jgi:3-dehydroquinate synthase